MPNDTFQQPSGVDQNAVLKALEKFDRKAFTKAMLGKAEPGFLDYMFPNGQFSQTWDLFDNLVQEQIKSKQKESQQAASQGPPMTFGQASQSAPQAMQALGFQPPQVPLVPPQPSVPDIFGGAKPVFSEREYMDVLNKALARQMPSAPQVQPGEMVSDFSAPLSPVQEAQVLGFASKFPEEAAKEQAKPPQIRKLEKASPGDVLVDPATGKAVFTAPAKPEKDETNAELTKVLQTMQRLNIAPDSERGQQYLADFLKKSTTPTQGATASATVQQESTIDKILGEEYLAIQKTGAAASPKINKLQRMGSLLEGVTTGKLTPAMTELQALGESLGFQVDASLPAKQALESLSNEIALELRNTGSGNGMPGQLSDKDREFLVSMTPGLSKTREGNRLIIETRMALLKREQEVAKIAREYRRKHGKVDDGLYEEIQRYADAHPLFKGKTIPKQATGETGGKKVIPFSALPKGD